MQCGDLERYLEAFLDGRLGRSRGAILRRHLAACGGCRARVERLRQFERDMQRRFRSMEETGSVWQGLELDLVASSRSTTAGHLLAPPRHLPAAREESAEAPALPEPAGHHPMVAARRTARGRASRLAGVVLIAMALGALYQAARLHLGPGDAEAAARAYLELLREGRSLALRSEDADQLQAWLSTELGTPMPEPPEPAGFRLLGADRAALASGAAGALVYGSPEGSSDGPVVLFVQPAEAEAGASAEAAAEPHAEEGLHELVWQSASFRYRLVGRQPHEALQQFVE
jgi:anti-sigma factor RsiW